MRLAPLRPEDSAPMFEWINDRALVVLSSPFKPVDEASHREWFEQVRKRPDVEIFGIRLKEDDRLIGSCQLNDIDRENGVCNLQIRIGEAGARGRGYGTEVVRTLLHHAFAELGLERVRLEAFETNRPAIRAYEKAGFRREGLLPEPALIEGEQVNVVVMAALKDEASGDGG